MKSIRAEGTDVKEAKWVDIDKVVETLSDPTDKMFFEKCFSEIKWVYRDSNPEPNG